MPGAPRAGHLRLARVNADERRAPRPEDVESFRKMIEPIFMRDRGGTMPGYAACVMCHTWQTSLRFDLETPATDAASAPATTEPVPEPGAGAAASASNLEATA